MSREEARASLAAIVAAERREPLIDPENGTRFWLHETPAERALVLLHGFTNNPRQYVELGPFLHAAGYDVIAPRLPFHGYRDRMSTAIARLRRDDVLETALVAVGLAARLAPRVDVAGISLGGAIAAWLAPRVAIDTAVAIAPFFGIKPVPGDANDVLGSVLERVPNAFVWWDPIHRADQLPRHGYPRFSTAALGATMRLAAQACRSEQTATRARRVVGLLNARDPIVNNALAQARLERLTGNRILVDVAYRDDLPPQHDVIEPTLPHAPTAISYPWIRDALER